VGVERGGTMRREGHEGWGRGKEKEKIEEVVVNSSKFEREGNEGGGGRLYCYHYFNQSLQTY
jgi:hypothetical protein